MTWRAQLDPASGDASQLAETFQNGDPTMKAESGSFWLESSTIGDDSERPDPTRAKLLLDRCNGAARVLDPAYTPVGLSGRYENRANGELIEPPIVMAEAHMFGRSRMTIGGPPQGHDLVHAASENDDIADLLRTAGSPGRLLTWVDLYKIVEIVAAAVGGFDAILKQGWVTKKDLSRFTATANRPGLAGDGARHAHDSLDANPTMTQCHPAMASTSLLTSQNDSSRSAQLTDYMPPRSPGGVPAAETWLYRIRHVFPFRNRRYARCRVQETNAHMNAWGASDHGPLPAARPRTPDIVSPD